MNDSAEAPLRLWISYPWAQREEGDFAHLIFQLKEIGIRAGYDAVEVRPETQLWPLVERKIAAADGWAYVLTPVSVMRRRCVDELTQALDRAHGRKGKDFPVFGLLHGVSAQHLPPALRMRPSFSLADPQWKKQVEAVMKNREGSAGRGEQTRFEWKLHPCFGGDPEATAVEVGAKKESIPYWRFAVPRRSPAARWGQGPRGGGEISPIKFSVVRGSGRFGHHEVTWFGAANAVSLTESAYAVFLGHLPEFVCFGPARGPTGPPGTMEMFRTTKKPATDFTDFTDQVSGSCA